VIKCLKDEGIYVWLDLHVQRKFQAGRWHTDFDEIRQGKATADLKGFNYVMQYSGGDAAGLTKPM